MASDLSPELAEDIADSVFNNTDNTILPVANVYVTVFDDTDTERDGDFGDARLQTAPADWIALAGNGSKYENDTALSLGEAIGDVDNLQDVALYDAATGGNEIARFQMVDAPFNVADGTELVFEDGDLNFDFVDRTQ